MPIHTLPGLHEPFSALSHMLAAVVFGVLYVRLIRRSWGDPLRTRLLAIYGFCCVLLLSMSGTYHMLPEGTARSVLLRLDKAAIFLLIVGTHTPVQGFFFRGVWRWGVLAVMWGIAVTGITLFSVFADELPRGLGTTCFLLLGWIGGISGLAIWRRYGFALVRPIFLGGVAYSLGAIPLSFPDLQFIPGIIHGHEIWHIAVLVGVSLHWRFMHHLAVMEPIDPSFLDPESPFNVVGKGENARVAR